MRPTPFQTLPSVFWNPTLSNHISIIFHIPTSNHVLLLLQLSSSLITATLKNWSDCEEELPKNHDHNKMSWVISQQMEAKKFHVDNMWNSQTLTKCYMELLHRSGSWEIFQFWLPEKLWKAKIQNTNELRNFPNPDCIKITWNQLRNFPNRDCIKTTWEISHNEVG